ncbi:CDC73-domain-containing protein [Saccharata proteae CBS 121410]|uniref:CDC73-domain-containing protein n=1 Tax=Saccharata proteae CBS 121410 TaxID=1314787 RepID=A0A9P4I1U0_9PEZI|nr:CDC73-domain-containing protein [Saccharata proteae CBS 121410]
MAENDALINLRQAIAAGKLPIPTTTADASHAEDAEQDLAKATYLQFNHLEGQHRSIPLNEPTRYISGDQPIDLRSVYFTWQKKDAAIAEYITSTQRLNEALAAPGGAGGTVKNLVFAEKLDLVTWLEGGSDESENIKPLASESKAAADTADIAAGAAGGIAAIPSGTNKQSKAESDSRLLIIYNSERKMGDRNTVLHGIKPTDFSHVRKHAASFLQLRHNRAPPTTGHSALPNPSLVSNLNKKASGRRLEPIILLSPSASSLIRMSNVKPFLSDGTYLPADSAIASSTGANLLHLTRMLPTIDPTRPTRFILVDSPDQFKPDYWGRVVAVFTTGQTWQFKSYKWTQPAELFSHALGIYVGWKGEGIPDTVRGWGRGVVGHELDKFNPHAGAGGRWRDREVVEQIWRAIELSMRAKGWTKDGPPGART